jgi:hypothetical protein
MTEPKAPRLLSEEEVSDLFAQIAGRSRGYLPVQGWMMDKLQAHIAALTERNRELKAALESLRRKA